MLNTDQIQVLCFYYPMRPILKTVSALDVRTQLNHSPSSYFPTAISPQIQHFYNALDI